MPLLNDVDSTNAMIDRLFFVSFPEAQPIEKRDLMLLDKLKQEQELIVVWAVQGLS